MWKPYDFPAFSCIDGKTLWEEIILCISEHSSSHNTVIAGVWINLGLCKNRKMGNLGVKLYNKLARSYSFVLNQAWMYFMDKKVEAKADF